MNPLQQSPAAGGLEGAEQGSALSAIPQPAATAAGPEGVRRARAIARNLKISPQKLNDFARVIRHMRVDDAIMQCRYSVKKASKIVETVRPALRALP